MTSDARWSLLEGARKRLLDSFCSRGVNRIEYVAAFPHLDALAVWLCTVTDRQRDSLRKSPKLKRAPDSLMVKPEVFEKVRQILLDAGFASRQLSELSVLSQSQETVDRKYDRSWFYATRYT